MTGEISNHLWQSTLFAIAAALVAVALRRNQARIRYWIWFTASVKFFVPFTLLITFGSQSAWAPTAYHITPRSVSSAMGQISQPFGDVSLETEPTAAPSRGGETRALAMTVLAVVWLSGVMALALIRFRLWWRLRAVVRSSLPRDVAGIPPGVRVRCAAGLMEPGVVGWWRPVLLMPHGIEEHLSPEQLAAVIAHELCHLRRRDNLTSTIHMAVEAVFWFHPLVWWIGARLIEERERACDEAVLQLYGDPRAYAEGILNVCKRYAKVPLPCVSGVSGANLRKRIEAIMMNRVARQVNVATGIALAATAVTALAIPVAVGAMSPAVPQAVWTPASGAPQDLLTALEGTRHDSFIDRARAGNIDLVFFGATEAEMWRWPDRGKRVWDQAFGSLKAASFGSQGSHFDSLLWRMRNGELDGYQAKLVVLHGASLGLARPVTIASGDQLIGDRQAEFVANYGRLIAEIRARQPRAKILLSPSFPRGQLRREAWQNVADANAAVYRRLADNSTVFYDDIGGRFFRPDGSHNREMWTMTGPPNAGIHEPGFRAWADALQPWVDRFVR